MINFTFIYKEIEVPVEVDISYSYESHLYYIDVTLEEGWRDQLVPEHKDNTKKYPTGEMCSKLYNIMSDLEEQTMMAIKEVEPGTGDNIDWDTVTWNSTILNDDTLSLAICPNKELTQD